jgi:hypothetical protein
MRRNVIECATSTIAIFSLSKLKWCATTTGPQNHTTPSITDLNRKDLPSLAGGKSRDFRSVNISHRDAHALGMWGIFHFHAPEHTRGHIPTPCSAPNFPLPLTSWQDVCLARGGLGEEANKLHVPRRATETARHLTLGFTF